MEQFGKNDQSKVSLKKKWCYLLIFLFIVVPVLAGVLAWHFTKSSCSFNDSSETDDSTMTSDSKSSEQTYKVSTNERDVNKPWKTLRLPNYVIPVHYNITLYPNFYGDNGWFYGNETIEIDVTKKTKIILIHANFLNITQTRLRYNEGGDIRIARTFWYEENQFWVIETAELISVAKLFLELQFDGSLVRDIVGFYKSSYVNSKTNEERHLASSKFQPVDARRAFPCFDEPNIKARYTISLVHQPDYTALSNMPATETVQWEINANLQKTTFERSVRMSTYLVCFVVCDFEMLSDTTKYGTQIRVFATPDRIEQATYSLHVMKISMEKFQELFKIPFPLPKNDMIAIPNFGSGAMEHWGLITYREVNMLYDAKEASAANKQRVAVVVAHEIAHMITQVACVIAISNESAGRVGYSNYTRHESDLTSISATLLLQWFGNIVTMDWWDDLWLNEGFASFVEYLGVHEAEPEWEMLDQMVVDDVLPVMVIDAGVHSHPIVVDVNHPDQITEVFDDISYSKGATVIRMLQEMMGRDAFFDGVNKYLVKYEWGTATTANLWSELGQVPGGYNVTEVMDTWTRQMGLPYINITFSEIEGTLTRVTAVQSRFLADKNMVYDENESPFKYRWYVNLDYNDNGRYYSNWITKHQDSITFDIARDMKTFGNLVKFNVNQTGFYRINYPDFMWRRFAETLLSKGPTAIPYPADRTGLIDDAFNLARGGYLSYDVGLEMTKYLDQEFHYLPWSSAYRALTYMKDMFTHSGNFNILRQYVLKKVRPILDHLTWSDGPTHLDNLMRSNIIKLACEFADPYCLGNATQRFRDWIDKDISVSPNIRTYVYQYGMSSSGSAADWDALWQKYTMETVPQEKIKLLLGLANTKYVWLLNRYLEDCKNPEKIRAQDFFSVVMYIAKNPIGNSLAWDWVRYNWEYLVSRFTLRSRFLGRLIPRITQNFNTPFKLQQLEEFFTQYQEAGAGARGRQQAKESIQRNIAWMENNGKTIVEWLQREISK